MNEIATRTGMPPVEVSTEEMADIAKELGLVQVSKSTFTQLRSFGVGMEQAGIPKLTNGYALLSLEAIRLAIVKLQERITLCPEEDDQKLQNLIHTLGYITHKGSQIGEAAVNSEETSRLGREESERRKRHSFMPGQVVIPVQVNVNKS